MNNFFRTFFAAFLAFVAGNILLVFIAVSFLVGLGMAITGKSGGTVVHPKSVLHIDFSQPISDNPSAAPISAFELSQLSRPQGMSLLDVLGAIDRAASDPNIEGIYINPAHTGIGIATAKEIRDALLKFKESGKFIESYADHYSQGMYYLGSVADRMFVNGQGGVDWYGLASEVMFYKGLLNKLGLEVEVFRHGEYKAAVEPFISDKMSPENREQLDGVLGSIWGNMLREISLSRTRIDSATLHRYASELAVIDPSDAVKRGMVEAGVSQNLVESIIAATIAGYNTDSIFKSDSTYTFENLEGIKKISLADYIRSGSLNLGTSSKNKVALVYAEGEIVDGTKPAKGSIVGGVLAAQLAKLRNDDNVKAVVLRINSPGGSALASEVIWGEVSHLRMSKPVIVSMGNTAASGGYYIAAPADVILASPGTITGSIGVFGLTVNGEKTLEDKLGITVDVAKTNPSADVAGGGLTLRSLTAFEKMKFQRSVDNIYTTFVGHVAEGRNLSYEEVDRIAGGRVWSGADALQIGLIDGFGGVWEAIELAADRAGIASDFQLTTPETPIDKLTMIMDFISSGVRGNILKDDLGAAFEEYSALRTILLEKNVQARMPYIFEIK